MRPTTLAPLLAAWTALGCTPGTTPATGTLAEYCSVVGQPGLEVWVGDVATVCSGPPAAGDSELPAPCSVHRVRRGALTTIALPEGIDARLALGARDGRLVVLTTDERLLYGPTAGPLSEIASWAAEPRVSDDGQRVAYVALADGFVEPGLGVPTQIVVHDLASDRREVVTTDELASSPFPMPNGSREVLFVSTQTGTASLWRASPGASAEQITNIGIDRTEQGFVPVPSRQLEWIGASEAVFTAQYEDDRIWRVDVTTGTAEELGPGGWPRANADGSVTARRGSGTDCAVLYLEGRTP